MRPTTAGALFDRGGIPEGTRLLFKLRKGHASEIAFELRPAISRWLAQDDRRRHALWRADPRKPLVWEADGQPHSLSGLVVEIVRSATGETPRSVYGAECWWSADGRRRLTELGGVRRPG